MYRAGTVPRLPFYDDRLCDFFCTVPGKFLEGRRFQIDYLKRFAPDLARIKWQRFDANLYRYRYFKTLQLPRRVAKKIGRAISGRRVPARNWEVQFSGEPNRRKLEACLLESDRLQELLEPGRIGELIDEVYRTPKAGNGYALSMLLTFSAWLERFG